MDVPSLTYINVKDGGVPLSTSWGYVLNKSGEPASCHWEFVSLEHGFRFTMDECGHLPFLPDENKEQDTNQITSYNAPKIKNGCVRASYFLKKNAVKKWAFQVICVSNSPFETSWLRKDDSKFIRTGFASCIRRIHPLMWVSKSVSMKSVCFLDVSYPKNPWTLQNRGVWLWKKAGFSDFF